MSHSIIGRSVKLASRLRNVYSPFAVSTRCNFASKAENETQVNQEQSTQQRFFPRRCCMYIPGDNEKMLDKSLTIKPDTFVFDCEDGVAANRKVTCASVESVPNVVHF